jgi:hypothetical protein
MTGLRPSSDKKRARGYSANVIEGLAFPDAAPRKPAKGLASRLSAPCTAYTAHPEP